MGVQGNKQAESIVCAMGWASLRLALTTGWMYGIASSAGGRSTPSILPCHVVERRQGLLFSWEALEGFVSRGPEDDTRWNSEGAMLFCGEIRELARTHLRASSGPRSAWAASACALPAHARFVGHPFVGFGSWEVSSCDLCGPILAVLLDLRPRSAWPR